MSLNSKNPKNIIMHIRSYEAMYLCKVVTYILISTDKFGLSIRRCILLLFMVNYLLLNRKHGWHRPSFLKSLSCGYVYVFVCVSVHDGCLLWGTKVVVPAPGRNKIANELHEAHPGITRMKALARSFVWRPQIDKDLEELVKNRNGFQSTRHLPPVAPLQPREWPQGPWARVYADYVGPFMNKYFLLLVDAHSKWIEVRPVNNATSTVTVDQLCLIFATHGLPEMLVTDNGTVFTSEEFNRFTKQNGIHHVGLAPYYPASNDLVERAVQTFKDFMKKMKEGSVEVNVSRFLLQYCTTPHSTTGISPAEMLIGRHLRSRLDLVVPDIRSKVLKKQQTQIINHDKKARNRTLQVGDTVSVHNFPSGNGWLPGIIEERSGPLSFQIKLQDGRIV